VCDGLSALKQAQSDNPTEPTLAHYDIIGAIQTLKGKLRVRLNLEHVRGHQDDGVMTALTRQAWMNIEMDELTKKTIDPAATQPTRYHIPGEPRICYAAGKRLVKNITGKLRSYINKLTIKDHWDQKVCYKQGHKSMIDYKMAGQADWEFNPGITTVGSKNSGKVSPVRN